ncbi:nucleolar complex protein 2 homolog [Acanthaster planci]|uniref:Nucleolar complex protein 2 homolog n=1 Tax=Acanthaster planci TaxID=133434 RepID=A0A8B7ZEV2_ACAPL|nr:nucleolar complex protein 2 homolog [Acanthaster planci]
MASKCSHRKKIEDMTAEEMMAASDSDSGSEWSNPEEDVGEDGDKNVEDEEDDDDDDSEDEEGDVVEEDEEEVLVGEKEYGGPEETTIEGKKMSKHKQSLEKLKETDPEFYKFLQENDQELLAFDDSDDELSSDEEGALHELPDKLEEQVDSDDEDYVAGGDRMKPPKREGKDVTLAMVDKWRQQLEANSLNSFQEVVKAFRAAVQQISSAQEGNKYRVEGSGVFNAVVSLCLKHVHPSLQNILQLEDKPTKKRNLPSSSKRWKQVQASVKFYLTDIMKLLKQLSETTIVCVVLRHIHRMIPYFCCYPRLAKDLVKGLVGLWSTGEEAVRVLSFLSLFSIHRCMLKNGWLEYILKQMYLAYVRNTKFTSPSTLPLINFMQRSLTEMFAVNTQLAYQHGFVYIRQLAIHLRNAITVKKKDTYQSVYNWQYIHCLNLWCRVLATLHADETLHPLIYPLVQTAIGVVKLIPAARYYPLRFQVVRSLNLLSEATGTFIPLLPFLLEIFEFTDFNKKHSSISFRPLNFAVMLKVSKSQLNERAFKDGLIDQLYELLLEHLQVHSHAIGFPELALPVIMQLKAFLKKCKVANYCKVIKGLLEKVQETCQEINRQRDSVTFGVSDDAAVKAWENKVKMQGTTLSKHYATYKNLREKELRREEAGKETMTDDIPTLHKRQLQRKEEDKRQFGELFEADSDSEDDILVRAERKQERYTPSKRGQKRKNDNLNDDGSDNFDDDEGDDSDEDDDGTDEAESGEDATEAWAAGEGVRAKVNPMSKVKGKVKVLEEGEDKEDIVRDFDFWCDEESEGVDSKKKKKNVGGLKKKSGKKLTGRQKSIKEGNFKKTGFTSNKGKKVRVEKKVKPRPKS